MRLTKQITLPPSWGGDFTDTQITYDVLRLVDLPKTRTALMAPQEAAIVELATRAQAFDTAWATRQADGPISEADRTAHATELAAFEQESAALLRDLALTVVRYLCPSVRGPLPNQRAVDSDPASWDWIPTPLLHWMLRGGADTVEDEVRGPLFFGR